MPSSDIGNIYNAMKSILELSNVKAREYFLETENYCNMQLPAYFDFKPIIGYVASAVGNKSLDDILKKKDKKPSYYESVNHVILFKKDARYAYRPIQLLNPYLYYLLVREMTTRAHWKEIVERFNNFNVDNIEVASIPKVREKSIKCHSAANVTSWWESVEQRSLELALSYRYMFVTDISNCYASIYTHSVAWAFMEKDVAKKKRGKGGYLGNTIDNYLQGMQYGQTNGIPQGSTLSDFIAEAVLGYADKKLGDKLRDENIADYRIVRYRDDYRIFSNYKDDIERIAFYLQEILMELNFQLNASKTFLTEDIVRESIKADKMAYILGVPLYRKTNRRTYSLLSNLQQEAFFIHNFSRLFPNSGQVLKLLTTFAHRLESRMKSRCNVYALMSILVDIALYSPKSYKHVLAIISMLIDTIQSKEEKTRIVKDIYLKFSRFPNTGEVQIWMQQIAYELAEPIDFTEGLCKIVNNEPSVHLWNNEWVADEYKRNFPQYQICSDWIKDKYSPVIDIDDISLFDTY